MVWRERQRQNALARASEGETDGTRGRADGATAKATENKVRRFRRRTTTTTTRARDRETRIVGSGRVGWLADPIRGSDSRGKILDASSRGARCARPARAVAAAMIGFYDFCFRDSFIASERRVDGSATAMPTRWIPMMDLSKKRELAASWCQDCQE